MAPIAKLEDFGIEVPGGSSGLKSSIEVGRCVHTLVTKNPTHDLITARMESEINERSDVAEEMKIDREAGIALHRLHHLNGQGVLVLAAAIGTWKERRIARLGLADALDVPADEIGGLVRQLEVEINAILHLLRRDGEHELPPSKAEVPLEVEAHEVLGADRCHEEELDGHRHLTQGLPPVRRKLAALDLLAKLQGKAQELLAIRQIVERPQSLPVLRRQAVVCDRYLLPDLAHLRQGRLISLKPMAGHALEHGGHVAGRGARLASKTLTEVEQAEDVAIRGKTGRQGGEALRITALVHEGRGEGAQMIVPGLYRAVAQRLGRPVLGKIFAGTPGKPVVDIFLE